MKIAIFGCGLIGKKRGLQLEGHELVGVFDPDQTRGQSLAKELQTKSFESAEALLSNSGAEIAIVAVTNSALAPVALSALKKGKHVLIEKPAGITLAELNDLKLAASTARVALKVGFNHRFHPAILKMRTLVDEGALGPLMFMRARYGHGGRLGYEKEWRADPKLGGGGELMDQGVHLLDLVYWFLGPLPLQSSWVTTNFWDMPVDDNAVLTLADRSKKTWASFHVSCSEWKNTFSLELYGRTGKVLINGLGGSYGKETLTYYRMLPEMGPPPIEVFEFDGADKSWALDLKNLVDHIRIGSPLLGDIDSARYAMEQVTQAYRDNKYLGLPCSV